MKRKTERLKGVVVIILVFLDFQLIQALDHNTSPQYYGLVGCVFSPALCHAEEECIDDGLFGSCQRSNENHHDHYSYHLSHNQLVELEQVLYHLATSGYTWRHLYTQCRVMSALLSYRYDIHLRNDFCERGPRETETKSKDRDNDSSSDQLIDDLIDMLSAKISLADKEESLTAVEGRGYGNRKESPAASTVSSDNSPLERQSAEMFEKLLRRLSDGDVKVLKEFLIQQHYSDDYKENGTDGIHIMPIETNATVVVKKMNPGNGGTITKVVVHYDPEAEMSLEGKEHAEFPKFGKEDKVVREESSPSVDTAWSMAPAATGEGLSLPSPSVMRSGVAVVDAVPLQGRLTEQGSASMLSSADDEFNKTLVANPETMYYTKEDSGGMMIALYVLCGLVVVLVFAAVALVILRHQSHLKEKLQVTSDDEHRNDEGDVTDDLQDLCRENMRKNLEEDAPSALFSKPGFAPLPSAESGKSLQRGNAVSRPGDHVISHMSISTGHMILSYMEDHLSNKDKLDEDWQLLCSYDVEPGCIVAAIDPANRRKNRHDDMLPYEQTRVRLDPVDNVNSNDYINASTITDDDPRCPAYIAAQGPLPNTVADFWQMVWEQGSSAIVCLTTCTLVESDVGVCFRYWPADGLDLYHIYEVKLFEEHRQAHDDYIIRNFCLRNTKTNESRTVTQFHYLTWSSLGTPSSIETLMDFRRKVNRSYHGRFCPIIVHCSDGAGQTGAYCLIDMVLNRIDKGAREMDIAATLEHIRDQRFNMVRTKEQFEFCLMAIAYEVENILSITSKR